MSAVVDVILITGFADQPNVEALSFWMGTADAANLRRDDPGRPDLTRDPSAPSAKVGSLLPLNGPLGEELWGGHKVVHGCVWAAATTNLHWDRFLDQIRRTNWTNPEQVQLLLRDDGDTYFRMYMFLDGQLRNIVPAPPDGGFDRDW